MSGTTSEDFLAECEVLDGLVRNLDDAGWAASTPAVGWTIAHQIGHLVWTDAVALLAVTDATGFAQVVAEARADPGGFVDRAAETEAAEPPTELLARWRARREDLAAALDAADPTTRVPWFGPPMRPRSMATARLMEVWAHGQDVADTLGVRREPTERLKAICHLGVRTRDFAYAINGLEPPAGEFRVELTGPDGQPWMWGPEDSDDIVRGEALDFCLLVTQRREPDALGLVLEGEARRWASFAQAFAGEPKNATGGRP